MSELELAVEASGVRVAHGSIRKSREGAEVDTPAGTFRVYRHPTYRPGQPSYVVEWPEGRRRKAVWGMDEAIARAIDEGNDQA